jgi:F-type H+-transporting ATPase subunit gamma
MRTLRDIRKRIRTVRNIQQITKTMQMVSAAKLRKSQNQLLKFRAFAKELERIAANMVSEECIPLHPLLEPRVVRTSGLVVVTSDKGLCGAYNTNVIRRAEEFCAEHTSTQLILVGKKAANYFRRRPYPVLRAHVRVGGRFEPRLLNPVGAAIVADYLSRTLDEVYMVYTTFRSTSRRDVVQEKLLGIEAKAPSAGLNYILEPDAQGFLESFLPRLVTSRFLLACAEAFASEHAGRMVAMKAATDNAEEMIRTLTLQLNRARQTAITKELADIVGGVEALK